MKKLFKECYKEGYSDRGIYESEDFTFWWEKEHLDNEK